MIETRLNFVLFVPDSLSHRASVRQALAKDETWISSYFSKLMAMLQRQENSLLRLFPGSKLVDPPNPGTGNFFIKLKKK